MKTLHVSNQSEAPPTDWELPKCLLSLLLFTPAEYRQSIRCSICKVVWGIFYVRLSRCRHMSLWGLSYYLWHDDLILGNDLNHDWTELGTESWKIRWKNFSCTLRKNVTTTYSPISKRKHSRWVKFSRIPICGGSGKTGMMEIEIEKFDGNGNGKFDGNGNRTVFQYIWHNNMY